MGLLLAVGQLSLQVATAMHSVVALVTAVVEMDVLGLTYRQYSERSGFAGGHFI